VDPAHLVVVVRHRRDLVAAHVADLDPAAVVADQDDVAGTGRALECGLEALPDDLDGTVVVTMGDVPLLEATTLQELLVAHVEAAAAVTIMTAVLPDPTGYGRVVRDEAGAVAAVVEHKDATAEQRTIAEVNSGVYAFDAEVLRTAPAVSRSGRTSYATSGRPRASTTGRSWPVSGASSTDGCWTAGCARASPW
jgi:bifunctional UDP-N-acetylglucosamine pyrophosphorylase/glucosamine-1-phosphate N-acetyltransferase